MNAPRAILEMSDEHLAAMPVKPRVDYLQARLLAHAWKAHAAHIAAPITAGGITFVPGADFKTTLDWMGHSYLAAKNGVVSDFVWVHDDGSTQDLTAAELVAIYEAGAARIEQAFDVVGKTILPGIAGGTITTKAQIDAAFAE